MKPFLNALPPLLAALALTLPLAGCGPSKSELANEIATLKEQLAQRQTEGKTLQQQVASTRSELDTDRKALAEVKAAAETANKALAEARLATDGAARLLVETRAAAEADRKAAADAQSAAATAGRALEEARSTVTASEARLAELERDSKLRDEKSRVLAQTVEERTAEVNRTRSELAKTTDAARQTQAELQQSLDQARASQQSAAAERDALSAELAAVRARASAIERELQQNTGNLEQEQKRASDLTDRLAAAVGEQSKLRTSTDAQRSEIAAISAALADAQAKVARLTGARGIYTVQDGDSLSSIALFFYRNAYRWPGIAQANKHLINHPDRIFPAMVLIIPK
jgi:nucleoid-associated protein YgaU